MRSPCRRHLFHGYVLVIAGHIIMLVMCGTLYSFGGFFKPLLAEPGWSTTHVLGVYSLCFFLSGALAAPAGWFTDRVGPRAGADAGMSGGIAPVLTIARWYRAKSALMTGLVVGGAG